MITLPIALAACLSFGGPSTLPGNPPDLRGCVAVMAPPDDSSALWDTELKMLVDSGIAMLRGKRYVPFLERFIDPKQHEGIVGSKGIESLADAFKKKKAGILLNVLTDIRGKKPVYDPETGVATYTLRRKAMDRGVIEFARVDGRWYIQN